jgi:ABC-type uncharacterized transport system permease subunit
MKNTFARDITGFSFIAAALMFWGGWMLLPVHINIYFTPEDILTIQGDLKMYLWMYRVHIFGMIITIAAMAALGTVFPQISSRVLVNPGLAVISTGMAATALGSAFFYQFGTSGAYDLKGMPLEAVREFVASLKLDTQYAGCFMRFGRVFTGLGMVILGAGLWKSKVLPSWTGITAIIIGIAAMAVIIAVPTNDLFYIPVLHLKAFWLAVMGITILRSQISFPAPY